MGKQESDANRSNMVAECVCHEVPSARVSKDSGGETGRAQSNVIMGNLENSSDQ